MGQSVVTVHENCHNPKTNRSTHATPNYKTTQVKLFKVTCESYRFQKSSNQQISLILLQLIQDNKVY